MRLPQWEDFKETITFWGEMDPVYEEILAQALRGWPEPQDFEHNQPVKISGHPEIALKVRDQQKSLITV